MTKKLSVEIGKNQRKIKMSVLNKIWDVGKRVYLRQRRWRRFVLFFVRAVIFHRAMAEIFAFFEETETRRALIKIQPNIIDFVPRRLFYADSTVRERVDLIKFHIAFLEKKLGAERLATLFRDEPLPLWRGDFDDEQKIELRLAGMRKEGLFSIELCVGARVIYNINAWIDRARTTRAGTSLDGLDSAALWIGAMQGTNADDAQDIIKRCAKHMASYRPKNLILYAARAVARGFGCEKIIAVSNAGFYANNGLRIDRKLKTDLNEFWMEADGEKTADARFYELKTVEHRKSLEEMKPNKRSMYRKRFKLLDEIDAAIAHSLTEAGTHTETPVPVKNTGTTIK